MSNAIAQRIAAGKANQGGNWIKPGAYLFEVQRVVAENKFAGDMFIAELLVLECRQTDPQHQPNAVGSTCSLIVNLTQLSGPGNAKAFLMALFDVSEEEVTVEAILETCSETQPARFMQIRDEAYTKPKKTKPTEVFTANRWEHVPVTDADLAAIAKRRAAEK